jgi:RimJ/RimL family protein N-acetyltransferase
MRRTLGDLTVRLREAQERDLPAIARGIADPDVVRWFGASADSADQVLRRNAERWADLSGPTFAICLPDEQCVGLVWVNRAADRPGLGSVGYWLLPEARGRGLATRAVVLVAEWAFTDLGLERLRIVAESANAPSRRVAERAGFRRTGERTIGTLSDGRRVEYLAHERSVDSDEPGSSS